MDLELDEVMQVARERPAIALGELRYLVGVARDAKLLANLRHLERYDAK